MINCIDLSTWNSGVDYYAVKSSGIVAAILRAGFGRDVSQVDSQFENHYKGCRDAGLKIGIYWYSYADSVADAETEARTCLSILNGRHIDMPIYFDMEEAWQTSLGKSILTAMAERFCETIRASGYRAGVYSNLNWFYNYLDYDYLKSKYSIWLAQWASSYSLDCDIWQNSETGDINGISGNCDTNVILNRDVIEDITPVKRITAQDAVNMAYSLIGTDENPQKCDIMAWYGNFDDGINEEECCCAGMMYLFDKLGALDLIPSGKTANCGTLALNFYNAGQLYKPEEIKVGDLVIFSWNGKTTSVYPLNTIGYKTLQHVEICTAVNDSTIVSVGVNNGGNECDDWQKKTHDKAYIAACCRPNYKAGANRPVDNDDSEIKQVQKWLNAEFNLHIAVDGLFGKETLGALIKALQTTLNTVFGAGLDVDGIFGSMTRRAIRNLERGDYGNYVCILQGFLICRGYDTGGFDGDFGSRTESAVRTFQTAKSLVVDGIAGKYTFEELANS